ncbi:MAG: hypothetical protein HOI66_15060, partial [Verrucomicrobia bacterium]|nr:hypothetical protein [Verrucomicrobiota bacterium]
RVLIVKNTVAFAVLFPHLDGQVLGSYSGRLSNGGEELRLIADDELVQTVVYDDQWYPPSDGEGFTLAANLSEGLDLDWSVAASWRLTRSRFGTPASESTTTDQDGDRIPDLWELDQGLNPLDASDAGVKVPDSDLTWFEVWTAEGYGRGFNDGVRIVATSEDDGLVLRVNSEGITALDPSNWVRRIRFERKYSLKSAWFPVTDWLEDFGDGVSLTLNAELGELASFFRASVTIDPR